MPVVNGGRSNVKLIVYNSAGEEVKRIIDRELEAGSYIAEFDRTNFLRGVYFYKFTADDFSETKSMILLK